jgi:hypothetical protein
MREMTLQADSGANGISAFRRTFSRPLVGSVRQSCQHATDCQYQCCELAAVTKYSHVAAGGHQRGGHNGMRIRVITCRAIDAGVNPIVNLSLVAFG